MLPPDEILRIFDADFYLEKYSDIRLANMDPLEHFHAHGIDEGRNPNKDFDIGWYKNAYLSSETSNSEAIRHYIDIGRPRGLQSRPLNLLDNRAFFSHNLSSAFHLSQDATVSIIMTVKDPIADWHAAIMSALGQTYKNIELLIIVDANSSESFKASMNSKNFREIDPRVSVIFAREGGRSEALNCGLEACGGKWICYLDSDNWWDPNFLNIMVAQLAHTSYLLAYCAQIRITDSGPSFLFQGFDASALRRGNYIDINSVMHSATLIKRGIRFNRNLTRLIDYDFFRAISSIGTEFLAVPCFLSFYDDTSNPNRISQRENFEVNQKLIETAWNTE